MQPSPGHHMSRDRLALQHIQVNTAMQSSHTSPVHSRKCGMTLHQNEPTNAVRLSLPSPTPESIGAGTHPCQSQT